MPRYPLGPVLLTLLFIFVASGLLDRSLERLKLKHGAALAVLAGWLLCVFIEIPLTMGHETLFVNLAGSAYPLLLGLFLTRAVESEEKVRTFAAASVFVATGLLGQYIFGLVPNHFLWNGGWFFLLFGVIITVSLVQEWRSAIAAALIGICLTEVLGPLMWQELRLDSAALISPLGAGLSLDRLVAAVVLIGPCHTFLETAALWSPFLTQDNSVVPVKKTSLVESAVEEKE